MQATAGLLSRPTLLLMVTEHNGRSPESRAAIRALHGCTRREARLAQLLAQGSNLRDAASEMGVTYETARGYLKSVFAKTGVRTQSQLVARLLSEGV